jgi:hypothetical protein
MFTACSPFASSSSEAGWLAGSGWSDPRRLNRNRLVHVWQIRAGARAAAQPGCAGHLRIDWDLPMCRVFLSRNNGVGNAPRSAGHRPAELPAVVPVLRLVRVLRGRRAWHRQLAQRAGEPARDHPLAGGGADSQSCRRVLPGAFPTPLFISRQEHAAHRQIPANVRGLPLTLGCGRAGA